MSSIIRISIPVLVIFSLSAGCASTGLLQSSPNSAQMAVGEVQVIGPVLRPQQVIIPASGTTIDRVISESRRTERQLSVNELVDEFIYVQRGITRRFVPTLMLNSSSLGDMRIIPGDVVCAIPMNQSPISKRTTGSSATITLKGLLTEQAAGLGNTDDIDIVVARNGDKEFELTLSSVASQSVELLKVSEHFANIGLQAGLSGDGFDIPAEIWVLRCVAEDGFIEEYVLPYRAQNDELIGGSPVARVKDEITDRVKLRNGDVVELTRIEFLPYAVEGQVISTFSETGSVPGVVAVAEPKRECTVEAGPLLQPLSAVLRNSAQQSSAVLRNSFKPMADIFRVQSGI